MVALAPPRGGSGALRLVGGEPPPRQPPLCPRWRLRPLGIGRRSGSWVVGSFGSPSPSGFLYVLTLLAFVFCGLAAVRASRSLGSPAVPGSPHCPSHLGVPFTLAGGAPLGFSAPVLSPPPHGGGTVALAAFVGGLFLVMVARPPARVRAACGLALRPP